MNVDTWFHDQERNRSGCSRRSYWAGAWESDAASYGNCDEHFPSQTGALQADAAFDLPKHRCATTSLNSCLLSRLRGGISPPHAPSIWNSRILRSIQRLPDHGTGDSLGRPTAGNLNAGSDSCCNVVAVLIVCRYFRKPEQSWLRDSRSCVLIASDMAIRASIGTRLARRRLEDRCSISNAEIGPKQMPRQDTRDRRGNWGRGAYPAKTSLSDET